MPPGADKPSVYEVARHAGVSTATGREGWPGTRGPAPDQGQGAHRGDELGTCQRRGPGTWPRGALACSGCASPDLDQDEGESEDEGDAAYWYDEVIRGHGAGRPRRGYAMLIAASHRRDRQRLVLSIAGRCDGLVVLARTAPLR